MAEVYGPDWPAVSDVMAANRAALESLATPWEPYERYRELLAETDLVSDAFFDGILHRMVNEPTAEPEPEAGS